MADRTFRPLSALRGASTSRVLNLHAIGETMKDGARPEKTLFSSMPLNASIIIKHRMRANDLDAMPGRRNVCTKLIVPFDPSDLRAGGKSLFVGQNNYRETLRDVGQYRPQHDIDRDMHVLKLLDDLPSLDPFLLREKLRANGIEPDDRYFAISPGDQQRMFDYTAGELNRLTDLAGGNQNGTGKMVSALLSSDVDEKLEPLRQTLSLGENEFREGVFSWRGFIYYKWCFSECWPVLVNCLRHLSALKPVGAISSDQKSYLAEARKNILLGAKDNSDGVRRLLQIYDDAYGGLLGGRNASQFKQFLLNAPALFLEIGEKMGTLSHITNFWRFRFADPKAAMDAEELVMVLQDLSKGFSAVPPASGQRTNPIRTVFGHGLAGMEEAFRSAV